MNSNLRLRTVFFIGDQLCFCPYYNKTDNFSQKEKFIARFLDNDSTLLVLEDLIFLRPLAAYFNSKIGKNKENEYSKYLFVFNGVNMSKEKIRDIFHIEFMKYFELDLKFGQWRQLVSYYSKEFHIVHDNGMYIFHDLN